MDGSIGSELTKIESYKVSIGQKYDRLVFEVRTNRRELSNPG